MLAAPFAECQERATPTLFRARGGPQRIAPHARSRGLAAAHLARMARLEIGAPRCGPPLSLGHLRVPRRSRARDILRTALAGVRAPPADRDVCMSKERGADPWVLRAVRDRAP